MSYSDLDDVGRPLGICLRNIYISVRDSEKLQIMLLTIICLSSDFMSAHCLLKFENILLLMYAGDVGGPPCRTLNTYSRVVYKFN